MIPGDVARRIRCVLLDVDGVLTDGGVYVGETDDGRVVELKRFDIIDNVGVHMLKQAGIRVAIVSGRVSSATRVRAEELGIECEQQEGGFKLQAAAELIRKHGLSWEEVAFLGDDIPDVAILCRVGLPVVVANASAEARAVAAYQTRRSGGRGAVRELAEVLLQASGEWNRLMEEYLVERDPERAGPSAPANAAGA
jgi:3-deoxy-D-manno-octulosonate 8-phosphate phosphatase (KDO 8-P phosphatase)